MRVTTTIVYDQITERAKRTGPCTRCGRKTTRSRTFSNTVSPFNTVGEGADQRPATPAEVHAKVVALAAAWTPTPDVFDHTTPCERPGE